MSTTVSSTGLNTEMLTVSRASHTPEGAVRCIGVAAGSTPEGISAAWLAATGFTGSIGQISIAADQATGEPVVLVGCGGPNAGQDLRAAVGIGGELFRKASRLPAIAIDLASFPHFEAGALQGGLAEGLRLASYRFDTYLTRAPAPALTSVTLVGTDDLPPTDDLTRVEVVTDAVCIARELVNEPGGVLTAPEAARRAEIVAAASGFSIEVADLDQITEMGLGALVAVNRGSTHPARLVMMRHEPANATHTIALVGKGVCFDTGGNNVKSTDHQTRMKKDMAGGAAVIGAMAAIARLNLPVRVLAWVPFTDNMNGGDAMRPGDIVRTRNGQTIEVLDTDNEGRLILADALSLASEAKPDVIIDIATLTGTVGIAVGRSYAGLMGNDEELLADVRAAGDAMGEPVWPFPLSDENAGALNSAFADMKNNSPLVGFTSSAGCLLQRFVAPGIPWAHIDMAAQSFSESPRLEHPAGATGWGVRLLLETINRLLERWDD